MRALATSNRLVEPYITITPHHLPFKTDENQNLKKKKSPKREIPEILQS